MTWIEEQEQKFAEQIRKDLENYFSITHDIRYAQMKPFQEPKTCDCQLEFSCTGKFMCHGMCIPKKL